MFGRCRRKGMTIPEVLISIVVGTVLIGVVLGMWYFAYKNWSLERIRSKLRIDLEVAMETMKSEIRLSSADYMSYYKPAGETEYTAISFPAATPDADGFFTLNDETGLIEWDRSIIYHIYENPDTGLKELRRTEFTDNNYVLTDADARYEQLEDVVTAGDYTSAENSQNGSTKTIIEGADELSFTVSLRDFGVDLYSPATQRSDKIEFGSITLDAGNHDLTFEVVGRNDDSSGYAFGIDTIYINPSGGQREAEYYTPSASSGDGYTVIHTDTDTVVWSGDNYAEYAADAVGDYVTLALYYDLWRESNFESTTKDNVTVTGNDPHAVLSRPRDGAEVCWQASDQTGDDEPDTEAFSGMCVRDVLYGDFITQGGNSVRVKFRAAASSNLVITKAYIVERDVSGAVKDDDGTGTAVQILFGGSPSITIAAGAEAWSDWATFAVEGGKDYFVTFSVESINAVFAYWKEYKEAGEVKPDCGKIDSYLLPGTAAASQNIWTGSRATQRIYAVESLEVAGGGVWNADDQTGSDEPADESMGMAVRIAVAAESIALDGDLVRVKFAATSEDLHVTAAYIEESSAGDDGIRASAQLSQALAAGADTVYVDSVDGFPSSGSAYVYDPDDPEDTHMSPFLYTGVTSSPAPAFTGVTGIVRSYPAGSLVKGSGAGNGTQLYFSDSPVLYGEDEPEEGGAKIGDDGGSASESVTIPGGYYVWSNWAEFAVDDEKNYLVTFYVFDSSSQSLTLTRWESTDTDWTDSYYCVGRLGAGEATWNGSLSTASVYSAEAIEAWSGLGTVTSAIYDTKIQDPSYNGVTWDGTTGSAITVKVRSSDSNTMTGATDWDDIAGLHSPGALSIGEGRYVQFQVTLTRDSDYGDYADYPWVDDVAISWDGESKMCEIGGYFAKKPDYGIIKLLVDGQELTKALELGVTVTESFRGETYEASMTTEVEPRNTGR